jgi:16S rRNA (cytosine1402-N4)-methyltransferase
LSDAHQPVLLDAAVAYLCGRAVREDDQGMSPEGIREGVYVDATFGRGGHTRRLLALLGAGSRVVAVDRDPDAVAAGLAVARQDARLTICHGNFSELPALLAGVGVDREVQGVLMDLGVSSPQLDYPERGFSFRHDAPLDLRMDNSRGPTAAQWLNSASEEEIARVLKDYGEERYARRIAGVLMAARPIASTGELARLVTEAQPRRTPGKHDATRVFQAVRMQVNGELESLQAGLDAAFECLAVGGRLVVISFHSLEDRLVKRQMRALTTPPPLPRRLPIREPAQPVRARSVVSRAPAAGELAGNPRSRSARLRVVEKVA